MDPLRLFLALAVLCAVFRTESRQCGPQGLTGGRFPLKRLCRVRRETIMVTIDSSAEQILTKWDESF